LIKKSKKKMAASVKSVPNPYFGTKDLTSFASSIVSRRRIKVPCNHPTTYSHNSQSARPYILRFDISDPENFIDTDSMRVNFDIDLELPATRAAFIKGKEETVVHTSTTNPDGFGKYISYTTDLPVEFMDEKDKDTEYDPLNRNPFSLDGGLSALVARVKVSNVQGLVIEEHTEYNLWSNIIAKFEPSFQKENDLTNFVPEGLTTFRVSMELKSLSIFKQMKYFPLFLFRSALRIEIEFEDPKLAFYMKESTPRASTDPVKYGGTVLGKEPHDITNCYRLYYPSNDGTYWYNTRKPVQLLYEGVGNYLTDVRHRLLGVGTKNANKDGRNTGISVTEQPIVKEVVVPYARFRRLTVNDTTVTATDLYPNDINYSINNAELTLDFVKPSSDVMLAYINAYNSPSGIPYSYVRTFYHTHQTTSGTAVAPLQLQLPFSVRSLRGIFVVITDQLSSFSGNDITWQAFPSLSSFMTRGLRQAQLVVGAQQFPSYRLDIRKPGSNLCTGHLPELETIANQLFSAGGHDFSMEGLGRFSTNYHDYGYYDGLLGATADPENIKGINNSPLGGYRDTRDFILGFSTQKFDGDFASGIDTTASGQITLNLTFDEHVTPRKRQIHIFGIADAVFTLQKDASLVRY
jgi:hypothetical protein